MSKRTEMPSNPLTYIDYEDAGRLQSLIEGGLSGPFFKALVQQAANQGGQAEKDLREILETARSFPSIRNLLKG